MRKIIVCGASLMIIWMLVGCGATGQSTSDNINTPDINVTVLPPRTVTAMPTLDSAQPIATVGTANTPVTAISVTVGTSQPRPTDTPLQVEGNVVTTHLPFNTPITMQKGQMLVVVPPRSQGEFGWDVTYDKTIITLDPQTDPSKPPPRGWVWTVVRAGTTTIAFASKIPPCTPTTQPCVKIPSFEAKLTLNISP